MDWHTVHTDRTDLSGIFSFGDSSTVSTDIDGFCSAMLGTCLRGAIEGPEQSLALHMGAVSTDVQCRNSAGPG